MTPDQLQSYLNTSGEGDDRKNSHKLFTIHRDVIADTYPCHRHLVIASGLDLLKAIKRINEIRKSDSRGKTYLSAHMATER